MNYSLARHIKPDRRTAAFYLSAQCSNRPIGPRRTNIRFSEEWLIAPVEAGSIRGRRRRADAKEPGALPATSVRKGILKQFPAQKTFRTNWTDPHENMASFISTFFAWATAPPPRPNADIAAAGGGGLSRQRSSPHGEPGPFHARRAPRGEVLVSGSARFNLSKKKSDKSYVKMATKKRDRYGRDARGVWNKQYGSG